MLQPRPDEPTWMVAHSREILDPSRYLGELGDLPVDGSPGDWCDVVITDREGVMRWTLVAVDCTSAVSIFAALRGGGASRVNGRRRRLQASTCIPNRGEGEVAPLSPGFSARGPAAGTDRSSSAAGSARRRPHGVGFTSTG
jgi:hypothetical protein